MEYAHTIVVVGGEGGNPAKLHTQIEPLRLDKDMSMGVTSISHGEIYNVHSGNNKIYLNSSTAVAGAGIPGGPGQYTPVEEDPVVLEIPVGRYCEVYTLLKTIDSVVKDYFGRKHGFRVGLEMVYNRTKSPIIKITPTNVLIYVTGKENSLWNLLGVAKDVYPGILLEVENQDLFSNIVPAFLYVNIVENSYINGKLSRNLALVPLSLKGGCSFYEFNHPNYVPIVVKDFSDILLELRTLEGRYVPFNSSCKTVITLNLKAINRAAL